MRRIFPDTSYWIAVLNPRDQAHARAVALSKTLQPAQITTSDEVLTEILNYFAECGDFQRRAAACMVERIQADHTMRVFLQTRDGFLIGLGLNRARPDKGYSLTDCISMDLMRRTGLTDVLTDDAHCAQEGSTYPQSCDRWWASPRSQPCESFPPGSTPCPYVST